MFYLNVLISSIISTYFNNSTCLVHFYDDLSNAVQLNEVPVIRAYKYSEDTLYNEYMKTHYKCENFLLQFKDSLKFMLFIENVLANNAYAYNNRKYIIIINDSEDLKNFFGSTHIRNVQNILVIYVPNNNIDFHDNMVNSAMWNVDDDLKTQSLKYDLLTHKYIGLEGNNDIILLDTWHASNCSFQYNNILYPDKVTDQQGRILSAICYNISPYAVCNSDPPMGNEHNIIVKYAKRFNMTLMLKIMDIIFNPFGDAIDAAEDINGWDVSYGSIFDTLSNLDSIRTVYYTYVAMVPLPKVKYGIFTLVEAFDWRVWASILTLYIATFGVLHIRRKMTGDSNTIQPLYISRLELYGVFIAQGIILPTVVRNRIFHNYIIMVMSLACILLTTAFTTRLSSVMVYPLYEKSINTLGELADSDLKILFLDSGQLMNLQKGEQEIYKKLLEKAEEIVTLEETKYQETKDTLINRDYAVAMFRRLNGDFKEDANIVQFVHDNFIRLTPELFTNYYNLILAPNSMHTEEMRKLVMAADETGLFTFWEDDALRMRNLQLFNARIQEYPLAANDILYIEHLQGLFTFWGAGMITSAIIFLVELVIKIQQDIAIL